MIISYSYEFYFGKAYISFSSQMYPKKYYDKLKKLHDIVEEYTKKGERLPGLCLPEIPENEQYNRHRPENGKVWLEVFSYFAGELSFRILNGTGENIEVTSDKSLFREGENEPFARKESAYKNKVYANICDEDSIKVPFILEAGIYRLEACGLSCSFELK